MGHFAAGAATGLALTRLAMIPLRNPIWALAAALPVLLQIALLFAGNLYLLMTVAVVWHDPRLYEFMWRRRLLVDISMSFIIFLWAH